MDAVTYPTKKVIDFLNENVIALKIPSDQLPESADFKVQWTPALFILDQDGGEHQRSIGFRNPDELIPSILLGIGNMYFHQDNFQEAINYFEKILAAHPHSDAVPEAVFQTGVSRFKSSNDPIPLREAYEQLLRDFPENSWTKRAVPYRLIQ
ncbi:MAG: tetratricopeptide repeat protein [Thermodesulfobacteriota bacterium]